MPIVSRADCTEITPNERYKVFYTGSVWGANLTSISLTFAACNGYNGNNNNLYAYMQRLYFTEKKINASQLALLDKSIVGNNNCDFAAAFHMKSKGYVAGYQELNSVASMTQIAGRGLFLRDGNTVDQVNGNMNEFSFMMLYKSSSTGIILRICSDCEPSHEKIYVRFNPGFGPNPENSKAPFFQCLKVNFPQDKTLIGDYGVAWAMYSTYEDALARKNAWKCPNYNWGQVFPGDCDPVEGTIANQFSRFEPYYDGRSNAAWYIDAVNPFVPIKDRTFGGSKNFNSVSLPPLHNTGTSGGFDILPNGTMYIRGSGGDMWAWGDWAHFVSNTVSGDNITLSARLRGFTGYPEGHTWARACLMIRNSLTYNSASFELCLTSANDLASQWRNADGAYKGDGFFLMYDGRSQVKSGWMSVVKKGDYYSAYVSYNRVDWQQRGTAKYLPGLVNSTSYYVGIAVNCQHDRLAEAVFDDYKFVGSSSKMACAMVSD